LTLPRVDHWSAATWGRLAWIWTLLSGALLVFGAWAMAIDVEHATYYVQWQPSRPGYAPFRGELSGLALDGLTLTPGEVIPATRLWPGFFAGRFSLEAAVKADTQPRGTALIARLALDDGEFLMMGQRDRALVVRYRAKAHRARLRSPMFALDDAFAPAPGIASRVRTELRPGEVALRATGATERTARFRVSSAHAWVAFLPLERATGRFGLAGDIVWLALLVAPAAYAATRATASWRALAPVVTLAAGVALLAAIRDPALWWWPFWIAGALAAGIGRSLGGRRRLRAEQTPADGARPLEQHVLTLGAREEA
jgi:hypothetical protein